MSPRRCYLRPVDATHNPIELQDNTPINLGRGPITQIKDSRCSRNQVVFIANYSTNTVKVTQLGRNACAIDGIEMKKDEPAEIRHGQKFDVLLGQYSYVLEFDTPSGNKATELKRSINDVSDSGEEDEGEDAQPPPKQSKISAATKAADNLNVVDELWETVGSSLIIYRSRRIEHSTKIAAFDLDGTIIVTSSGQTFPKHPNDWKLQYSIILEKLHNLKAEKYKVVIFTNQASLNNSPNTTALVRAYQSKVEAIVRKLNLPVEVYVAKGKGLVRKPCIGMWTAMERRNGGKVIDKANSFYCGDAAGRIYPSGKCDFSQADLLFARNVGVKFFTPEEYFLGKKEKLTVRITSFDYNSLRMDKPLCEPECKSICSQRQELVVMVGCPGSGKSHFVAKHMVPNGYEVVSRDKLNSMDKCIRRVSELLMNRSSVVVDNTNPTIVARSQFLDIAKSKGIPSRIFIMNTTLTHAKHNNRFRQLIDRDHAAIGEHVINMFFQKYEEPDGHECSEVVKINFWPTFTNPDHETLYKQFLCDK